MNSAENNAKLQIIPFFMRSFFIFFENSRIVLGAFRFQKEQRIHQNGNVRIETMVFIRGWKTDTTRSESLSKQGETINFQFDSKEYKFTKILLPIRIIELFEI